MPRMSSQPNIPTSANQAIGWGTFEAPNLGTLWLVWSDRGLMRLSYDRLDGTYAMDAKEQPLPPAVRAGLTRYFAGEQEDFASVALDLRGTPFQVRVWRALRDIPWGEVRSYAHIAAAVESPRAMRAVGAANGANPLPIIVPCHRVVEASSKLGGYTGGLERKRVLLELEGARIREDVVQPGQLSLF